MLRPLANWIANTEVSQYLQNQQWVVPTSQSIHILAVAMVFSSACMINLRLLGVGRNGRSVSQLTSTLLPWMWRGLLVLLATGLLQTLIEPVRQFVTPAFWAKMFMILIVSAMTIAYGRAVRRHAARWDTAGSRPRSGWLFAIVSTLLWLAIIACGRFIAYTWILYT